MNTTSRFSDRVENYVKYRPHYPTQILDFLRTTIHFSPSKTVADIGSGTGISTKLFLDNGNKVYGIEPNKEMRLRGEEVLKEHKQFISVDGTAEHTGLPAQSVDLIVAGQAFHWFNAEEAKVEFKRIAKPSAHAIIIWNERLINSPFEIAYENLLLEWGTDYATIDHRNVSEQQLQAFYAPELFQIAFFPNQQTFDFEGLKGRLLSCSYVPNEQQAGFEQMITQLTNLFKTFQINNKVKFDYATKVYVGKI